ncbi:response regulator transcription factor [Paenibacillus sp. 2TAB23]|uniref:response regulator transcription factor n=1 Tax=Paenibacillus sp. 2TAB23 TaxID=3233004 RepID=UPI003F9A6596
MEKTKILIIEDEAAIADILEYGLNMEGYETEKAYTGANGLKALASFKPNLLILDWMLPDQSGLDICKQVTAAYNIPILMITAKSDITDKILGLEFGADDYITKPFDLREVIARIRTILRRVAQANRHADGNTEQEDQVIHFKEIEIAISERVVKKSGKEIELTPKEYDLLLKLYTNRGKIFTRTELLDYVWGYDYTGDTRTVDTHIQRLRKKLDAADLITTVFSIGYKFNKHVDTSYDPHD